MKHVLSAFLALLLIAPGAVAGGASADVTYLEQEEEACTYDYHRWHYESGDEPFPYANGSWSHGYEESTSCAERSTYADAHVEDDNGTIAHVALTGDEWSDEHRGESQSGGRWSDGSHSWTWSRADRWSGGSEGWRRDAAVETTAGSMYASRECSTERYQHEERSEYNFRDYDGEEYYHRSKSEESSYTDTCEESVTVSHGDRSASAGHSRTCSTQTREHSHHWNDDDWRTSHGASQDEWSCGDSVYAGGAGESASAGTSHACTQTSQWSSQGQRGENGTGDSYSEESCHYGNVVADGPMGFSARVGPVTWFEQSCQAESDEETCSEESYVGVQAIVHWEENPAGPTDENVLVPVYLP